MRDATERRLAHTQTGIELLGQAVRTAATGALGRTQACGVQPKQVRHDRTCVEGPTELPCCGFCTFLLVHVPVLYGTVRNGKCLGSWHYGTY